jgi:hypothetical protein
MSAAKEAQSRLPRALNIKRFLGPQQMVRWRFTAMSTTMTMTMTITTIITIMITRAGRLRQLRGQRLRPMPMPKSWPDGDV